MNGPQIARKVSMALGLALVLAGPLAAAATSAEETFELVFRAGTLDEIESGRTLLYDHDVTNRLDPAQAARATGTVTLTVGADDRAHLTFRGESGERPIGAFPAAAGNPVVMYFVEGVVGDMAALSGGSPFYIRNRIKDALREPVELETQALGDGQATADSLTLRPFEGDPNAARMRGFDALTLTFTLSEAVPGWYVSLAAEVAGPDGTPVYASTLTAEAE